MGTKISLLTNAFASSMESMLSIFAINDFEVLTNRIFRGDLSSRKKFEKVRMFSKGSQYEMTLISPFRPWVFPNFATGILLMLLIFLFF